jgi:hypothetical protein
MYRKLKRTWSNGYANYIPRFKETFPELNKIDSEELCDRFIELDIEFYCEEETSVSPWLRLTMPFAIALIILMLLAIPFKFLITGKWGYSLGEKNTILNWFKALKLQ